MEYFLFTVVLPLVAGIFVGMFVGWLAIRSARR